MNDLKSGSWKAATWTDMRQRSASFSHRVSHSRIPTRHRKKWSIVSVESMQLNSTKRLQTTVWSIQERVKTLGVLAFIFLCVVSSHVVLVIFKPFKHGITLSNHSERSRRRISIFSGSLAWAQLALNCDISPGEWSTFWRSKRWDYRPELESDKLS